MTELTDEEFERLWNGIDHRKGDIENNPLLERHVELNNNINLNNAVHVV